MRNGEETKPASDENLLMVSRAGDSAMWRPVVLVLSLDQGRMPYLWVYCATTHQFLAACCQVPLFQWFSNAFICEGSSRVCLCTCMCDHVFMPVWSCVHEWMWRTMSLWSVIPQSFSTSVLELMLLSLEFSYSAPLAAWGFFLSPSSQDWDGNYDTMVNFVCVPGDLNSVLIFHLGKLHDWPPRPPSPWPWVWNVLFTKVLLGSLLWIPMAFTFRNTGQLFWSPVNVLTSPMLFSSIMSAAFNATHASWRLLMF